MGPTRVGTPGRTDVPLTDLGREQARALGRRLAGHSVRARPDQSAVARPRDGELAGFGDVAVPDADLMEWDYGALEGRETADIRAVVSGLDDLARTVAGRRDDRRRRRTRRPGRRQGRAPARLAATPLSLRTDTCSASWPPAGSA